MFDLTKRPWRRLGRATAGIVSLAVVTTSMVALAAAGSADASPRCDDGAAGRGQLSRRFAGAVAVGFTSVFEPSGDVHLEHLRY